MVAIATYGRGLLLRARLRRYTVLTLALVLIVMALSHAATVPSLRADPAVPPTRAVLLLACVAATLLALLARDVLPDAERQTAINVRAARLLLFASAQIATAAVIVGGTTLMAPADGGQAADAAAVTATLGGMAMLAGRWNDYVALTLPWLYVVTGLVVGYDSPAGGGVATVRPWAWLVDDHAAVLPTIALATIMTLAAPLIEPARSSPADAL